jgi:hypothetical protein
MFCTKKIKNNKKYVKNGKMLAHVIFSSYFCGVKKEYKKKRVIISLSINGYVPY